MAAAAMDARREALARTDALAAAEAHADALRALAKEAENNKLSISRLELEAAQVGLDELRAGQ